MAYNHRLPYKKDPGRKKHRRSIAVLSFMLFIVISGIIFFVWYISQAGSQDQPQSDARSNNFNPLKTFESQYFTFQTDKTWKYIKDESAPGKFVYRSSKDNIVMRDMTVYVNTLPSNLLLTYVLPVTSSGESFVPGNTSDHCKTYIKDLRPGHNNPVEVTVESVRIRCQVDGTSATVGTGMMDGSYQTMLAGKSAKRKYFLLYHDLQYSPDFDTFKNIVRSFQAK